MLDKLEISLIKLMVTWGHWNHISAECRLIFVSQAHIKTATDTQTQTHNHNDTQTGRFTGLR